MEIKTLIGRHYNISGYKNTIEIKTFRTIQQFTYGKIGLYIYVAFHDTF